MTALALATALAAAKERATSGIITLLVLHQQPAKMSDLAARMGHTTAAATGLIDRLEREGLVMRSHSREDRRTVVVCLTQAGRDRARDLVNSIAGGAQ